MQVETNDQGMYVIDGVAPGRYGVQVQRAGYVAIPRRGVAAPMVDVNGQAVMAPDIHLDRGGAIVGRVLDHRGQPLPEAIVTTIERVVLRDAVRLLPVGPTAQTNDLGEFRLAGLAAGEYLVAARPAPKLPFAVALASSTALIPTHYPGFGDEAAAQPVRVDAGATVAGTDIIMLTAPAFQIAGQAIDQSGAPVASATVMITLAAGPIVGPGASARTQADGTFRVPNVTNGTYRVVANVPNTSAGAAGPIPRPPPEAAESSSCGPT